MMKVLLAEKLYEYTASLPARLIQRVEGEPYLERYYLGNRWGGYAYLHRFVAADMDEELHDHPWGWAWSLVLSGGYEESWLDRIDPREPRGMAVSTRWRRAGSSHVIRGRDFHRIGRCLPETWSLFVHGEWRPRGWGFLEVSGGQGQEVVAVHARHDRVHDPRQPWWATAPRGDQVGRVPLQGAAA